MTTILKALKHPADEENPLQTDKIIREVSSIVRLVSLTSTPNSRLAKAVTAVSVSLSALTVGKTVYDFVKKAMSGGQFTVKVSEQDMLFRIAEKWLMDALPDEKKLSVFASTSSRSSDSGMALPDGAQSPPVSVNTSYDGSIEQEVEVAGYTVKVSTQKPEEEAKSGESGRKIKFVDRVITFSCSSAKARDAVLKELERQAQSLRTLQPGFYNSRWGGFDRVSDIAPRPKESVVLKEGQMDRILGHIKQFRDNEDVYNSIGVPFRTGIMLYGPPGTGKSSTASVIANELRMNLYYISLKGMDDETLINAASRIPANSLVILEDIDVCKSVQDREATESSNNQDAVSMSAMLNVLDGFQSPPGVVFIMTTNRIDVLDKAIIRPGRVDLLEEVGFLDDYQLRSMVEYYTGSIPGTLPHITEGDKVTAAEVVGIVRKHIPDIENSVEDISNFVAERVLTI